MSLKKLLGTSLLCFSLVLSNVTALAADQNNVSDNKELTPETQEQTDTTQEVQTQSESQENEDGSAAPEQSEDNPDAQDTSENGTVEQTTEGQTEETQDTESEEVGVETQNADGVSLEQYAGGRTIQVDGDPKEWDGIPSYTSNDGSVQGVIKEIDDGGMVIEKKSGELEIINLDFVTRIRAYQRRKKKSHVS